MATYKQGILGPFSGRVGNVVGCVCTKRANYMRSRPLSYHDAKSEAQLRNRAKMRSTMAFLSVAKVFVNHTLGGLAERQTATNLATRWNFHKVDMGEGGSGARERYGELLLSKGKRHRLDSALLLRTAEGMVLTWGTMATGEGMQPTDKVHVLVYNETRHLAEVRLEAARRLDGAYRLEIPERWTEERLHVYVAVSDCEDVVFSDSQYFGSEGIERTGFSMQGAPAKKVGLVQSAIKEVSSSRWEGSEKGGEEEGERTPERRKGPSGRQKG